VRWTWSAQGFGGGGPVVAAPLAAFLRAYQLGSGYTPGPLLALMTLAGLAGTLSLARRHATPAQRDAARACLLTFTTAVAILLVSDAFEFSWRYQLPALITLPPAAALAITALFTHRRAESGQPPGTASAPGGQTQEAATQGTPVANGREPEQPQPRDRTPTS
jgi:hypothetical protein